MVLYSRSRWTQPRSSLMDANQTVLLSFPATLPSLIVALIRCPSVLWLHNPAASVARRNMVGERSSPMITAETRIYALTLCWSLLVDVQNDYTSLFPCRCHGILTQESIPTARLWLVKPCAQVIADPGIPRSGVGSQSGLRQQPSFSSTACELASSRYHS